VPSVLAVTGAGQPSLGAGPILDGIAPPVTHLTGVYHADGGESAVAVPPGQFSIRGAEQGTRAALPLVVE
jgi:hypothetical protein